jgi:hypothetical protein
MDMRVRLAGEGVRDKLDFQGDVKGELNPYEGGSRSRGKIRHEDIDRAKSAC